MGWAVLYLAFAVVALWLLGEVLLQYKARLRWRLLAFVGFLGVVLGVLLPSVVVIALGAIAFAAGQALVTLSFRSGFSTGWSLGGRPSASRRRRAGRPGPTLEVSDLRLEEGVPDGEPGAAPRVPVRPEASEAEGTAVLDAVPAGDETSAPAPSYAVTSATYDPVHGDTSSWTAVPGGHDPSGGQAAEPSYETASFATASPFGQSFAAGAQDGAPGGFGQVPYGTYETGTFPGGGYETSGYGFPAPDTSGHGDGHGQSTPQGAPAPDGAWGGQQPGYGYPAPEAQQPYAAYSDPYVGSPQVPFGHDPYSTGGEGYGYPLGAGLGPESTYAVDTPPGGVWVPQQRTTDGTTPPPYAPDPYGDSDGQGTRY